MHEKKKKEFMLAHDWMFEVSTGPHIHLAYGKCPCNVQIPMMFKNKDSREISITTI